MDMSNTNSTTAIYLYPINFLNDACARLNFRANVACAGDYRLIAEGAIVSDDRDYWVPFRA